jgi:hypothetical protein
MKGDKSGFLMVGAPKGRFLISGEVRDWSNAEG